MKLFALVMLNFVGPWSHKTFPTFSLLTRFSSTPRNSVITKFYCTNIIVLHSSSPLWRLEAQGYEWSFQLDKNSTKKLVSTCVNFCGVFFFFEEIVIHSETRIKIIWIKYLIWPFNAERIIKIGLRIFIRYFWKSNWFTYSKWKNFFFHYCQVFYGELSFWYSPCGIVEDGCSYILNEYNILYDAKGNTDRGRQTWIFIFCVRWKLKSVHFHRLWRLCYVFQNCIFFVFEYKKNQFCRTQAIK